MERSDNSKPQCGCGLVETVKMIQNIHSSYDAQDLSVEIVSSRAHISSRPPTFKIMEDLIIPFLNMFLNLSRVLSDCTDSMKYFECIQREKK